MSSDIKLEGDIVTIEGEKLKTNCHSIILDNEDRRKGKPNQDRDRVALTHGSDDQLILNPGNGYSGGVIIDGEISTLSGILQTKCHSIVLKSGQNGAIALMHSSDDQLILNPMDNHSGGVIINGVISAKTKPLEIRGTLIVTGDPSSGQGGVPTAKKRKLEISSSNIRIFEDYPINAGPGATEVKPPSAKVDLVDLQDRLEAMENKIKEIKGQENWKYCSKCKGLFYAGGEDKKGVCPADSKGHDSSHSGNYVL